MLVASEGGGLGLVLRQGLRLEAPGEDCVDALARRTTRAGDPQGAGAGGVEALVADALCVSHERLHGAVAELGIAIATEDGLDDLADIGPDAASSRLHALGRPLAVLAMRLGHVLAAGDVGALRTVAAHVRCDTPASWNTSTVFRVPRASTVAPTSAQWTP